MNFLFNFIMDNWFGDLNRRKIPFGDSDGYIERLSGNSSANSRKFLSSQNTRACPKKSNKFNNGQNKSRFNMINKSDKLPSSDIDDAKWIEDRKKRFPKVLLVSKEEPVTSGNTCSNNEQETANDLPFNKSNRKFKGNRQDITSNKKRKTLFEMLVDESDLSAINNKQSM